MRTVKRRSFGVIPIAQDNKGDTVFLILLAYKNWDFPKGGADEGEIPLNAALREMKEEAGIQDFSLAWGEVSMDTEMYARDKVASYYLAGVEKQELTLPVSVELGRPEHEEYRWVSAKEARLLLSARLIPVLEWAISTLAANGTSGFRLPGR